MFTVIQKQIIRLRSKNEIEEYQRKKGMVFRPEEFDFKLLKDNLASSQVDSSNNRNN